MELKKTWTRGLSLVMATAMLSSVPAFAARDVYAAAGSVEEAMDALADIKITQLYNGKNMAEAVHDYRKDGDKVDIDYSATLSMTEEMALYLQPRQKLLMKADFDTQINMDLDWLEFRGADKDITVTFSSTFLKPSDEADDMMDTKLASVEDGVFTYEMTMPKSEVKGDMIIPMELIVYYDGKEAYGYDEAKTRFADKPLMYADFTAEDWMHVITLDVANMQVKADKAETVTTNRNTWHWIKASGTVEGEFSYISDTAETIGDLKNYEDLGYVTELEFGADKEIKDWRSNEVKTQLKRTKAGGGGGGAGGGDLLNKDDHYSYIIGYNDGMLRPSGAISRAEVATIFFRMLTDEARDQYWSRTNSFGDVAADRWYNNAISTLANMSKDKNIINGYEDGTFRPDSSITRAEFTKIAVGFFKETAEEYQGIYPDVDKDAWYATYIEAANRVGLIKGFEDGTFRPNSKITRAEACAIVNRALDRHPEKDHLLPLNTMVNWPDNDPGAWYYADMMEATNSHDYHWVDTHENGNQIRYENWTEKLDQRDWAAYESMWSDAHSAEGGDVVKD